MTQDNVFWHVTDDLLKKLPDEVLQGLHIADAANRERAQVELKHELAVCDKALALFLEPLREGMKLRDKLEESIALRAAYAMASSLLNYLLLWRHAILLGYLDEQVTLKRAVHERLTRFFLFSHDESMARRFFAGKEISQVEVDKKITLYMEGGGQTAEQITNELRASYKKQTKNVHPNLESLKFRTLPPAATAQELSERAGLDSFIGGFLSKELGHIALVGFLGELVTCLGVFETFVREESGKWHKEYMQLRQIFQNWARQLGWRSP